VRLDALEIIARDDPDWILRSRELRQLVVNASLVRAQRAYGLRVIARLSQTRLYDAVPLIEPYRNDPLVQGSRALVELLIQMVLRRDESFYRQQREPVPDIYLTDALESEALELVFQRLLEEFAQRRPTLGAQWGFLLDDLETPFADRWAAHRNTLVRALIALTPPDQRPALRAALHQRLAQPLPTHRRLALQRALRTLQCPTKQTRFPSRQRGMSSDPLLQVPPASRGNLRRGQSTDSGSKCLCVGFSTCPPPNLPRGRGRSRDSLPARGEGWGGGYV
jgi:hypothetical protein